MSSNSGAYYCAFLRPFFLLILFEHVANALPVKRHIVFNDTWLNYKQQCPGGKSHNYCNKIQLFVKPSSVHHVALSLQSELHAEEDAIDLYTPDITGCVKNVVNHLRLLDQSLERSSGKGIFRRINDILWEDATNFPVRNITTAQQLDANTRFGILSHGTQPDPIYNYGNTAALNLFEQTIDRLCETPSRYSTVRTVRNNYCFFLSLGVFVSFLKMKICSFLPY